MTTIVQNGDPVLRAKAAEVPIKEIASPRIRKVLKDMSAALKKEDDGVAIAAPQIGHSLRIFVVSGKVFDRMREPSDTEETATKPKAAPDKIFINPVISKLSRKKLKLEEGCLSVRWLYGRILRSEKASVTAYDEQGKKFSYGATGLLAEIFQHETDHLNGILFIDNATELKELPPEHRAARRKKLKGE